MWLPILGCLLDGLWYQNLNKLNRNVRLLLEEWMILWKKIHRYFYHINVSYMYTLFCVYFFDYIRYEIKHIKKTQNCSISLSFFALWTKAGTYSCQTKLSTLCRKCLGNSSANNQFFNPADVSRWAISCQSLYRLPINKDF